MPEVPDRVNSWNEGGLSISGPGCEVVRPYPRTATIAARRLGDTGGHGDPLGVAGPMCRNSPTSLQPPVGPVPNSGVLNSPPP